MQREGNFALPKSENKKAAGDPQKEEAANRFRDIQRLIEEREKNEGKSLTAREKLDLMENYDQENSPYRKENVDFLKDVEFLKLSGYFVSTSNNRDGKYLFNEIKDGVIDNDFGANDCSGTGHFVSDYESAVDCADRLNNGASEDDEDRDGDENGEDYHPSNGGYEEDELFLSRDK